MLLFKILQISALNPRFRYGQINVLTFWRRQSYTAIPFILSRYSHLLQAFDFFPLQKKESSIPNNYFEFKIKS
jgi:hypothetical protein